MKKTILLLFAVLLSRSTLAQNKSDRGALSGFSLGVKAGVVFATFSAYNSGFSTQIFPEEPYEANSVTSFYIGGVLNVPWGKIFTVQPGLTLIKKGTKITWSAVALNQVAQAGQNLEGNKRLNPWYLEVPLNGIFNFKAGDGKFFIGAGPYVAFGLLGKYTDVRRIDGNLVTGDGSGENLKFGKNTDIDKSKDLKAIDFGLNFLLGYQLANGLNANLGYGLGLTNVSPNAGLSGDASSMKNRVISISLGFSF